MTAHQKFDLAKLERLNDPGRFDSMIPAVMWGALGYPEPRVIVDIADHEGLPWHTLVTARHPLQRA